MLRTVRAYGPLLALTACCCLLVAAADTEAVDKGGKGNNTIRAACNSASQTWTFTSPAEHVEISCQNGEQWAAGTNLNITIDGANFTSGLAFHFESMQNFGTETIKVYTTSNNALIYEGSPSSQVWMPTDQKSVRIEISKALKSTASVTIRVQLDCAATIGEHDFKSPILPNKLASNSSVVCRFNYTEPALFEVTDFNLTAGSSLTFEKGVEKPFDGPYSADQPLDHVIIGTLNTEFKINFSLANANQSVALKMTNLSRDVCKGKPMVSLSSADITIDVKAAKTPFVTCYWLLMAPQDQKVSLTVEKFHLTFAKDLLSAIDAGNLTGKPILQVTAMTTATPVVISSSRYLIVSLSSDNFDSAQEAVSFKAKAVSSGGRLTGNGSMVLGESSEYLLTAGAAGQDLVVQFGELMMETGEKVSVFTDFNVDSKPLITFELPASPPFDIASPAGQLRVLATSFKKDNKNVSKTLNFVSQPHGHGCYRSFVGRQESNMRVQGQCQGTAKWVIRPQSDDKVMFIKVVPNNVRSANISHLSDNEGEVRVNSSGTPFMTGYAVTLGARVDIECNTGECQNFVMSYTTADAPPETLVNVAAGNQNITLASPFYPGYYPFGGPFKYVVNGSSKDTNYLMTFDLLDLLAADTLSMANGLVQFLGKFIPSDMFIKGSDLQQNITLETTNVKGGHVNPPGAYGFHAQLMPTGDANRMEAASGNFSVDPKKCSAGLPCVYIIDLPRAAEDVNSSVSVNLTVTFSIGKNESVPVGDLLVWDGESSLRSPLLAPAANLIHGGMFSSRTHRLIVRYQGSTNLTLAYVASPCSYENHNMCLRDRVCMPAAWRCDGQLHCSDGSDELDCRGGRPPNPSPKPEPTAGGSGWKTAFWLCAPLFILLGVALTKGLPLAIQRVRDSRYQQFHDLGDH